MTKSKETPRYNLMYMVRNKGIVLGMQGEPGPAADDDYTIARAAVQGDHFGVEKYEDGDYYVQYRNDEVWLKLSPLAGCEGENNGSVATRGAVRKVNGGDPKPTITYDKNTGETLAIGGVPVGEVTKAKGTLHVSKGSVEQFREAFAGKLGMDDDAA